MKRVAWWLLGSATLLISGIGLGWHIRGVKLEAEAREIRFVTELNQIAIHTTNLDLICSNRLASARQLSEQRLFEAIGRANQLISAGLQFSNPPAIPNLTEATWRAASYAKANGASSETTAQADRLYEWLKLQQYRPAT